MYAPLIDLTEIELRDLCRHHIDTFENWSRRLIDEVLRKNYGDNNFDFMIRVDQPLARSEDKKRIDKRMQDNPGRFLYPDTVYDLIDHRLRECLKWEIKMRRCKNCGRLFAVTGHGGTEYCDRPADGKGRTCKEIGAFRAWEKSKSTDEAFKVFRREYKKRFAWIKAGRITKDEFYGWSERAREKRDECDAGKLTMEEFETWLRQS